MYSCEDICIAEYSALPFRHTDCTSTSFSDLYFSGPRLFCRRKHVDTIVITAILSKLQSKTFNTKTTLHKQCLTIPDRQDLCLSLDASNQLNNIVLSPEYILCNILIESSIRVSMLLLWRSNSVNRTISFQYAPVSNMCAIFGTTINTHKAVLSPRTGEALCSWYSDAIIATGILQNLSIPLE